MRRFLEVVGSCLSSATDNVGSAEGVGVTADAALVASAVDVEGVAGAALPVAVRP